MSASTESLEWKVDSQGLVTHLIESQNGTLSKAMCELIMNSVDKGCTKCDITLTERTFSVKDDGIGFADRADVEDHFGCFGKRHVEGDATYGRFRIGRGQIMALGKVSWHSHEFKMTADYKNYSGGYDLVTNKEDFIEGCSVSGELYRKLSNWELKSTIDELETFTKYMDIDIVLNGIPMNSSFKTVKWDYEDDDVMIKWEPKRTSSDLFVYSRGVFVKELSSYIYGLSCDIVTKEPLSLNMARNEIRESDKVWQKITDLLKAESVRRSKSSTRKLSEDQRLSMIRFLLSYETHIVKTLKLKLLKDSRGITFSLNALRDRKIPITVAPDNHPLSDHIASSKAATVFTQGELAKWGVSNCHELITLFQELLIADDDSLNERELDSARVGSYLYRHLGSIRVVPYDTLCAGLSSDLKVIKNADLSLRERSARNALQTAANNMAKRISSVLDTEVHKRKIVIGESQVAHGWTDGVTFIAINRDALSFLDAGRYGIDQITLLLLHEYCHDESDVGSHEHTEQFFSKFHDLSMTVSKQHEVVGHIASTLERAYVSNLTSNLQSVPSYAEYDRYKMSKVVLVTKKKGKLSELALRLLDGCVAKGILNYSKKGCEIELSVKTDKPLPLSGILSDFMAESGVKFEELDRRQASMEFGLIKSDSHNYIDWAEFMHNKETKHYKEVCSIAEKWASDNGHCPRAVTGVINSERERYSYSPVHLVNAILQDSNSDVLWSNGVNIGFGFETVDTKFIGVHYKIPSISIGNRHYYDFMSKDELAESNTSAIKFVMESIKAVVGSLKEDNDRQKVVELLSTDSFRESIMDTDSFKGND